METSLFLFVFDITKALLTQIPKDLTENRFKLLRRDQLIRPPFQIRNGLEPGIGDIECGSMAMG